MNIPDGVPKLRVFGRFLDWMLDTKDAGTSPQLTEDETLTVTLTPTMPRMVVDTPAMSVGVPPVVLRTNQAGDLVNPLDPDSIIEVPAGEHEYLVSIKWRDKEVDGRIPAEDGATVDLSTRFPLPIPAAGRVWIGDSMPDEKTYDTWLDTSVEPARVRVWED